MQLPVARPGLSGTQHHMCFLQLKHSKGSKGPLYAATGRTTWGLRCSSRLPEYSLGPLQGREHRYVCCQLAAWERLA